jgi:glycosyltransferase involved in cell wall biosynthesis
VDFPGFVANPFAYMARASLFALSSINEGLPGALIQAMACGCPVVSTDCPSGPAEILARGRYGRLVPPGDDAALAAAMLATLDAPPSAMSLRQRAGFFSVERAVAQYERVMLGDSARARLAAAAEPSRAAI